MTPSRPLMRISFLPRRLMGGGDEQFTVEELCRRKQSEATHKMRKWDVHNQYIGGNNLVAGIDSMWSGVNNFHSDLWRYDFPPWEALKKGQRRISLSQLHEVRSIFLLVELVTCKSTWKERVFLDVRSIVLPLEEGHLMCLTLCFFVKLILKGILNCNTSYIQFVSLWFTHDKGHLAAWSSRGSPGVPPCLWMRLAGRARPLAMWPPKKECRGMSCWQMWLPAKDLRLRAPRCPGWFSWWRWGV